MHLYFLTLCETSFRCKTRIIKKIFPIYESLCVSQMGGGRTLARGKPSPEFYISHIIIEWPHCTLCGLFQRSCDNIETTAGERS